MTISAAIIAKNEENNISRCLDSIRSICKQIVVLDTGSTDKTPIIASNFGANLYFHKWNNDFSEARNLALKYCYFDWILYIDSDEELIIDEELLNILSTEFTDNIGGISVNINNFLDEELSTTKKHNFTRIFRNDKRFKFTGKIHEQIADSILENNYKIIDSNITINHYGYIGKNIEKELRNKTLLEQEVKINNNIFMQYHLANTYFAMDNLDEAINIYLKIIENLKTTNSPELTTTQIEDAKIKTAQIYLKKNEYEKTISILENFISKDIDNEGLRQSIIAAAYLNLHNFDKAKEYYSKTEIQHSKLVNKNIIENVNKIFHILKY